MNVVEEYMNKVFTLVMLVITGACVCAGITIGTLKLIGQYPDVAWIAIGLFILTCVIYFIVGVYFVKTSYQMIHGEGKRIIPSKLKAGKIFIFFVEIIQFNFLSYMVPTREFWAYIFFFLILVAFFLDIRLTTYTSVGLLISTVISSIVRANIILPANDKRFVAEMVLRIVAIVLSVIAIILINYMVEHFLVHLKENQIEENESKIKSVLKTATEIVQDLNVASKVLADVSDNESSSTEELSVTSENLMEENSALLNETEKSRNNIISLSESSKKMDSKILEVEAVSKKLMDKSQENEVMLKKLQSKNKDVSESSEHSMEMSYSLKKCADDINKTLKIIEDISSQTSLLALNASIEAARAGEAGRGFAVVAESISGLADNTKESLVDIQEIMKRLLQHVDDMVVTVESNANILESQNVIFEQTFEGITGMMNIIGESLQSIKEMDEVCKNQDIIIQNTVTINERILNAIQLENEQFTNISDMIVENTNDVMQMTEQSREIDRMIDKLHKTLV